MIFSEGIKWEHWREMGNEILDCSNMSLVFAFSADSGFKKAG